LGLPYRAHAVDITADEQFAPAFLEISPNNKIPAIRDDETGVTLLESGAILVWLAERAGRFLPASGGARVEVMQWLMWQMGGLGPMLGQAHHFLKFNPGKAPYAEERFGGEARRLYGVLDRQLTGRDFVAGDYSIADMAIWPWIPRYDWQGIDLADYPAVRAWYRNLAARPAVQRGYAVPRDMGPIPPG